MEKRDIQEVKKQTEVKEPTQIQKSKSFIKSFFGFFSLKKILIIVVVAIAVIIIIILWLVLREDTNGGEVSFPTGASLEEKLKLCLEKDEMDKECEMLFINPEIYKDCEKLEDKELRDKCFYKIALINYNSLYCQSIENVEMSENCWWELTPSEDSGSQ